MAQFFRVGSPCARRRDGLECSPCVRATAQGTALQQDHRFGNKDRQLLKKLKAPPILGTKVRPGAPSDCMARLG